MIGHNTRKVLFLSFVLALVLAGYHGGMIGHNTRKVLFLSFVLVLVMGRS
jgi:branched-subunit amino acid ABC-type transport system permease component